MLKTAVPYDYGGIDIIDELPLPSSKKTNEKKEEKEDNTSKTQPTVSGLDEPSLRNVVIAAEDFIKVLATVSSSQSSTASSDRGETQSSEKKKRKKAGKKKNRKKQEGKGKWRKNRKQKAEMGRKAGEGTADSTSGSKGEVKGQSTFIGASHRDDPSGKHTITEYQPDRREEPLNEVMKDEPALEKDDVSMTSTPATEQKPESTADVVCSRTTTVATKRKETKVLKERGSKKPVPDPEELPANVTDISVTATRVSHPQHEHQPGVGPAKAFTVRPKVKRTRPKESGESEWRKKRRKDSSASPTGPTPKENNPADPLKAPLREAPRNQGRAIVKDEPRNTSFSVLKTQKLKEGVRSSQRKAALATAGRKPSHTQENGISPPPHMSESSHTSISATSMPTGETQAPTERLSPTTTAPSVTKNRHRQTMGGRGRWRKRIGPFGSVFNQTEQTAAPFTSTPPHTTIREPDVQPSDKITASTSASPVLTPVQVSVERLKAQFNRKKRRKPARRRQ